MEKLDLKEIEKYLHYYYSNLGLLFYNLPISHSE